MTSDVFCFPLEGKCFKRCWKEWGGDWLLPCNIDMLKFAFIVYFFNPDVNLVFVCVFFCLQTCLTLQPSHPQALTNLGNVYMERWVLLGCVFLSVWIVQEFYFLITRRNMMDVAASLYMATLTVTTGLSAPYNNLAIIYKQQVLVPLNMLDSAN